MCYRYLLILSVAATTIFIKFSKYFYYTLPENAFQERNQKASKKFFKALCLATLLKINICCTKTIINVKGQERLVSICR